jgi:hypothetical protein
MLGHSEVVAEVDISKNMLNSAKLRYVSLKTIVSTNIKVSIYYVLKDFYARPCFNASLYEGCLREDLFFNYYSAKVKQKAT